MKEKSGYWPAVRKLYSIQGLYMDTRVYTSGEPPVSHPATPNDVTPASVHFPFFIQDRGPPESPYKTVNVYLILKIYIYLHVCRLRRALKFWKWNIFTIINNNSFRNEIINKVMVSIILSGHCFLSKRKRYIYIKNDPISVIWIRQVFFSSGKV